MAKRSKISTTTGLERALRRKPPEIAVAIAARSALRVLPLWRGFLDPSYSEETRKQEQKILSLFRCALLLTTKYDPKENISQAALNITNDTSIIESRFVENEPIAGYATFSLFHAASLFVEYIDSVEFSKELSQSVWGAASAVYDAASSSRPASPQQVSEFAVQELWRDINIDLENLENVKNELIGKPLWRGFRFGRQVNKWTIIKYPEWAERAWRYFSAKILSRGLHWQVWIDWYQAILDGRSPWDLPRDIGNDITYQALTWPEEKWQRPPAEVNTELQAMIDAARAKLAAEELPAIPEQGPGPQFRIGEDDRIERVPAKELDADGNDLNRIRQLRPLVLKCANDLLVRLSPNEFPELVEAVEDYRRKLDPPNGESFSMPEVWGTGVILENTAAAAARDIKARLLPELEDPAKAALDSLLMLHGPMVLASREGRELTKEADNFAMTREQQQEVANAANEITADLTRSSDLIVPVLAKDVARATAEIGDGPHPERGSVYGVLTIKNLSIVMLPLALVSAPAALGILFFGPMGVAGGVVGAPVAFLTQEGMKESPTFIAMKKLLGKRFESIFQADYRATSIELVRRFAPFRNSIIRNEAAWRAIASNTNSLSWMSRYLDFICKKDENA